MAESYELYMNGEQYDEVWMNGLEYTEAWMLVDGVPTKVWMKGFNKGIYLTLVNDYSGALLYVNSDTYETFQKPLHTYNIGNSDMSRKFYNKEYNYVVYGSDGRSNIIISDDKLQYFINVSLPELLGDDYNDSFQMNLCADGRIVFCSTYYDTSNNNYYFTFLLDISFENGTVSVSDLQKYYYDETLGSRRIIKYSNQDEVEYIYGERYISSEQGYYYVSDVYKIGINGKYKHFENEDIYNVFNYSDRITKFSDGKIIAYGSSYTGLSIFDSELNTIELKDKTSFLNNNSSYFPITYKDGFYYFFYSNNNSLVKTTDFLTSTTEGTINNTYKNIPVLNSNRVSEINEIQVSLYRVFANSSNYPVRIDADMDYSIIAVPFYDRSTGTTYRGIAFFDNLLLEKNSNTYAIVRFVEPPDVDGLYANDNDDIIATYTECGINVEQDYGESPTESSSPYNVLYNLYPNATRVRLNNTGITRIGDNAFRNCSKMKYIRIPNGCSIGKYAFYNCTGIEYSIGLNSAISIDEYSFYNCGFLADGSVMSFRALNSIPSHSFEKSNVRYISFSTISSIGEYAFNDCFNLVSIVCTKVVDEVKPYAFTNSYVVYVLINGTPILRANAFDNAKNISQFKLSSYVYKMNEFVVQAYDDSTFAKILKANTEKEFVPFTEAIEDGIYDDTETKFATCKSLGVDITQNFYSISSNHLSKILTDKNYYKIVTPSVDRIGYRAFYNCSKLFRVIIGSGTKTIGERAFDSCSNLNVLTIPSSVTEIERYAFISSHINYGKVTFEDPKNWYYLDSSGNKKTITTSQFSGTTAGYNLYTYNNRYTLYKETSS